MKRLILLALGFYSVTTLSYYYAHSAQYAQYAQPYSPYGRVYDPRAAYVAPYMQQNHCAQSSQLSSLYAKASLSKDIRGTNRAIQAAEKAVTRLDGKLDEAVEKLAENLSEAKLKDDSSDVAMEIRDYIESKQDEWEKECPESVTSELKTNKESHPLFAYFYPRSVTEFFSFIVPDAGANPAGANPAGAFDPQAACGDKEHHVWNPIKDKCEDKTTAKPFPKTIIPGAGGMIVEGGSNFNRVVQTGGVPGGEDSSRATPANETKITTVVQTGGVPGGEDSSRATPANETKITTVVQTGGVPGGEDPSRATPLNETTTPLNETTTPLNETTTPEEECVKALKPWQEDNNSKKKYRKKGKVHKTYFCAAFAGDTGKQKRDCNRALKKIKKAIKSKEKAELALDKLEDKQGELEDESWDREIDGLLGDSYTEAGSTVCADCNRRRGQQTSGENSTAALKLFGGLLVAGYGMKEARRAQRSANETLALQGFPAENNFGYSLAGASLGMPFINSALYGSSHGNRVVGSYACSPQTYNHSRTGLSGSNRK